MNIPTGAEYQELLSALRLEGPWALVEGEGLSLSTSRQSSNSDAVAEAAPPPVHASSIDLPPGEKWISLYDHVSHFAFTTPDAIAVSDGCRMLTYKELQQAAATLSTDLYEVGIGRGDIVAVVLPRSIEFVVSVLAIWKLRAAYLPLGTDAPSRWRATAAERARVKACISLQTDSLDGCVHLKPDFSRLHEVGESDRAPSGPAQPRDLAYVIYTSGSTGHPKLVMVEQEGVSNLLEVQKHHLQAPQSNSRVLQFSIPTFDGAVFDIILALGHGCRLEVFDDHPLHLIEQILVQRRITHVALPATIVRLLEPGRFPDLEVLLSVGDECLPQTALAWREILQFINGYGPTEATVCSTLHIFSTYDPEVSRAPIGKAVVGTHVVLLDDNWDEVTDGQTGEICIGGKGVGRGYWGQAATTAISFIPDPYSPSPGARLYRTGDIGRRSSDGTIEFAGRLDSQIKISGFRVDTAEIAIALRCLPGIKDAAVFADENATDKRLVGYVIPEPGTHADCIALRSLLQHERPPYQVPALILELDCWPLNENGKIDRSRLPKPAPQTMIVCEPPLTLLETQLTEMAIELLRVERIGVNDDFRDLGCSSLLTIQFIGRILKSLGRTIAFYEFMENATVAKLAALLELRTWDQADVSVPVPESAGDIIPSFAQKRVWLLHHMDPQSLAYNAQAVMRFGGHLDVEGLQQSLTDIVRRHDVLRTRFTDIHGDLLCEVLEPWKVELPIKDISSESADCQSHLLGEQVKAMVDKAFDLNKDHLIRWLLVRISAEEHIFVAVEHHTVHDGWSFNVFLREMLEGYLEWQRKRVVSLPRPALQYYDYARWQRSWIETPDADKSRQFWREALAGAPTVLQLSSGGSSRMRQYRGAVPRMEIDRSLALDLKAFSQDSGVTMFTTLLAAFFVLVHRYSGAKDILVASGVANRRWHNTETLIGMFVNTIVFRGQLHDDPSFGEFLSQLNRMSASAYDHQELPFEEILRILEPKRIQGTSPLVQHGFSFHDSVLGTFDEMPFDVTLIEAVSNGTSKFDLHVVATPRYAAEGFISRLPGGTLSIPASHEQVAPSPFQSLDGITMAWDFDTELFDSADIMEMMKAYQELLRSIVEDSNVRVSTLSLLSEKEQERLQILGAGTERNDFDNALLHNLVTFQAALKPDDPAIVSSHETLSYREMIQQAEATAQLLLERGIGPGAIVAVLLPRSIANVTSILGILQAGAAYLPLDVNLPESRLMEILSESKSRAVLTFSDVAAQYPALGELPFVAVIPVDQVSPADVWIPLPEINPDDLAYIIYTSGSSGRPKGTAIEHRAVVSRLAGLEFFRESKSYLHLASLGFDVSVAEIFGPLVNGAILHIPPPEWTFRSLQSFIREHNITHIRLTTSLFHQIVSEMPSLFESTKHVRVGGDVLAAEALLSATERGPKLANSYGPTEATIFASEYIASDSPDIMKTVPIGTALPNTHCVILDDDWNLVPRGAAGEICIGGRGVGRGYLNMPGLTADKFIPDSWSSVPGARMYRTGDLGRWRADSQLEFLGRRDYQIKIRGFLVHPAEAQAALTRLPEVTDAIVLSDKNDRGEARLIAYVIPGPEVATSGAALRKALSGTLPDYLMPDIVTLLDAWPLNSNGKVDRRQLPAPITERITQLKIRRTAEEGHLCSIMSELLEMNEIDIDDNFFELGANSLLLMRFVARIGSILNKDIRLATVLANPTVASLAASPEFVHARSQSDDSPVVLPRHCR